MPDCPEDTDDHARGKGAIALLQVREREPPPGRFHRDGLPDPMIRSVHPKPKVFLRNYFTFDIHSLPPNPSTCFTFYLPLLKTNLFKNYPAPYYPLFKF